MDLGQNISWRIGPASREKDRIKNYSKFDILREEILFINLFGLIRLNIVYPISQSFR